MVGKTCFVPLCPNTASNQPDKIFMTVPVNPKRRQLWFEAVQKYKRLLFTKQTLFCCEDHFNLQEDAENWIFYKTMGKRLVMKNHVVPHLNILESPTIQPAATSGSQLTPTEKKRKYEILDTFTRSITKSADLRKKEEQEDFIKKEYEPININGVIKLEYIDDIVKEEPLDEPEYPFEIVYIQSELDTL